MTFNANKCVVLRCSRLMTALFYDYYINGSLLKLVSKHPYLGVLLDSNMSFKSHLDNIINKATKVLNFLRRNLYKCNQEVRCTAYTHLVRPMLEYASCVWDPYLVKDINSLEMVQRRAARWATSNYDWQSGISISSTLNNLQWDTLSSRRQISRLKLFYKAVHCSSGLKIPNCYNQTTCIHSTRSYHPLHYSVPLINTNPYKFSFFPRTIEDWNLLPHHLIELQSIDLFVVNVCMYISS